MLVGHSVSDADGRILTMDRSLSDLLRRTPGDVVGMTYMDLTHPADIARNTSAVVALRPGEGPLKLRKRYIRPDRSILWCDVHVSRFAAEAGGRLVGTIHLVSEAALDRGPASLWRVARRLEAALRQRRDELGEDLFSDHPWAILLQTYLAEAEGRLIRVQDIAAWTGTTPATTNRWINALGARGYVDREEWDEGVIHLSQAGVTRVERLLTAALDR